jgi:hypothetical protein
MIGQLQRCEEVGRDPLGGLGHKGGVGDPQGSLQGVHGRQPAALGLRIALLALGRGWGGLHLGQTVDVVVQQEGRDVHVVPDGVDPVAGSDGHAVPVSHDSEYLQVGAVELDAGGNRQGPTVDSVEPIGLHVVGEAAGAADPGNKHGVLRFQLLICK